MPPQSGFAARECPIPLGRSREAVESKTKEPLCGSLALERVMGIEPTRPAWKAGILPLNYTRAKSADWQLKNNSIHDLDCQYFFIAIRTKTLI